MDIELDEFIKQQKKEKSRSSRRDKDGDIQMGSTRGPGRRQQRQRKPRRDGPYSRSKYNTSGDATQTWKHDLYDKDDDEIEKTGWGASRNKKDSDLLKGTTVLVDNIHYEVSEEELKNVFTERAGAVRAAKIFYDKTGRSTGKGKVIFDKFSDAQTAVGLTGEKMKDQPIQVTIEEVKPRDRGRKEKRETEITFTVDRRGKRRSRSPTRITVVNPRARR